MVKELFDLVKRSDHIELAFLTFASASGIFCVNYRRLEHGLGVSHATRSRPSTRFLEVSFMITRSPSVHRTFYNREIHHRRSVRLKHYDYSTPGAYFLTVCTWNKECLLGEIVNGVIRLSPTGKIACDSWLKIPDYFNNVRLDEFVVMPNHIHGIIMLTQNDSLPSDHRRGLINQTPTKTNREWILMRNPKPTLGKIVRHYKARTSKLIHNRCQSEFRWHRNYYEQIIRDNGEMHRIRDYITGNPTRWMEDEENPIHFVRATGRSPVP